MKIAIIGAGLSGLALAKKLSPYANLDIFEKSRGVGGRMSTRYAAPYQFDHGAQFFTVKTSEFENFLKPHINEGAIREWDPRIVEIRGDTVNAIKEKPFRLLVGHPKMNHLCKQISQGMNIHLQTEIRAPIENNGTWHVIDKNNKLKGPYDWVVCTAPVEQTQNILPDTFSQAESLKRLSMSGCYSLMLGYEMPIAMDWDAAYVKDSCIGWIANNTSKPGRGQAFSLLIHTTNEWAQEHIDDNDKNIEEYLFAELCQILPSAKQPAYKTIHRWRYAIPNQQNANDYYLDELRGIAACGDWCISGRVESAYLSAHRLAQRLKEIWRISENQFQVN